MKSVEVKYLHIFHEAIYKNLQRQVNEVKVRPFSWAC